MDIKDSIRKAIREAAPQKKKEDNKSKPTPRATKWRSDTQPNIYELDNFLRKAGYMLTDILLHKGKPELIIDAKRPSHLYPDISHDFNEGNFYAKITDHGMLVASDLEEIIKGYNTALGVLKHLESLNLNNLELEEDPDES